MKSSIALAALFFLGGLGAEESPPARPRLADYERVRRKARAWFDRLKVDSVDLLKHGIKGKKKLTEILDVYLNLYRKTSAPAEREAILRRVGDLAGETKRREYHDLQSSSEKEFIENSMSYLRVAWLMGQFGLDNRDYLGEIRKVKPRLDDHFKARGPWQRAMFAEYYDKFGLEKPKVLLEAPLEKGVISRRIPVEEYDDNACYDLTHEVFVAFDYGSRKKQESFNSADLAYAKAALPRLVERYRTGKNPDLVAELASCMIYLGWLTDPACRRGIDFLLDGQNPDGTWGDYERYRKAYGGYLEQGVYLHTTMVVMDALSEAFEGDWPQKE